MDTMDFAEKVKIVRHCYGLSQDELAHLGLVSAQNVSKWELDIFGPKPPVKKKIADALFLSPDWFISDYGFPFLPGKIIILRPSDKDFADVLALLSLAAAEAKIGKIILWKLSSEATYYSVIFEQKDDLDSTVLVKIPVGYEKIFLKLVENHSNILYLGIKEINSDLENTLLTSVNFISETYREEFKSQSSESNLIIPKDYLFIHLYNMDKDELMKFIYAQAKSINEKINKMVFEKHIPDFLNIFSRHHSTFKKIVLTWLKEEPFSEKEDAIIMEFAGQSKLVDLINPQKNFTWERFLIHEIKTNRLEPFTAAYNELYSLVLAEGKKKRVLRPKIDEKTDKLYWPE